MIERVLEPLLQTVHGDAAPCLPHLRELDVNQTTQSFPPRIPEEKATRESKREPDFLLASAEYRRYAFWFAKRNFALIGFGDDVLVYGRTTDDWVVRLTQNPEPHSRFMTLASMSKNKHFPVVWFHHEARGLAVTVVERLKEAQDQDDSFWENINIAASLAHAVNDGRPETVPGADSLTEEMRTAALLLGRQARTNDYALDLNRCNIMRRPCNEAAVFIDPWVPWGS